MTSTFGGLSSAASGLAAARAAMNVTGENISNANTTGYTRQVVNLVALSGPAAVGALDSTIPSVGQGVAVTSISRLGDDYLDAAVRSASASSGYSDTQATALTNLEDTFNEPSANGISTALTSFWSSWQDLSNSPGDEAVGSVVIQDATTLASQISTGYTAVDSQWTSVRSQADGLTTQLNSDATQVAQLNATIRSTEASGGSANELIDQRSTLTTDIASIAGGTVSNNADGTVNVLIGGNLLVNGTNANAVTLTGAISMQGASTSPVQLEWASLPGQSVGIDSGSLAANISLLAPANAAGTGGTLAEAAASYNQLATNLANQVNTIHQSSYTTSGQTGLAFFSVSSTVPAALGLSVVPTSVSDIATGAAGGGPLDGSAADAISQLGTGSASPDTYWANFVSSVGAVSQSQQSQSTLADSALKAATANQQSTESVDTDEENVNLMAQQSAYEAAARVLTAIDDTLDTLINKTGEVGIA